MAVLKQSTSSTLVLRQSIPGSPAAPACEIDSLQVGEVLYHLPKAGEPSGRVEYVDAVPQTLALAGETEVAVARKTIEALRLS